LKKYNFIIPAAGIGERLRPFTNNVPKSMVRVGEKRIIEHQLGVIPNELVNKLVIITGYQGQVLMDFLQGLRLPYPVIFYINERYRETHCAYSLIKAKREMLEGFIYINSDLLFTKEALLCLIRAEYADAICARYVKNFRTDLEQIKVDNDKIIEWRLKTRLPNDGEVMGPLKISAESAQIVIEYCDKIGQERLVRLPCFTLFSLLLKSINYYAIFLKKDQWSEIDTVEDLEKAKRCWPHLSKGYTL